MGKGICCSCLAPFWFTGREHNGKRQGPGFSTGAKGLTKGLLPKDEGYIVRAPLTSLFSPISFTVVSLRYSGNERVVTSHKRFEGRIASCSRRYTGRRPPPLLPGRPLRTLDPVKTRDELFGGHRLALDASTSRPAFGRFWKHNDAINPAGILRHP